jgi:hypothetical protein
MSLRNITLLALLLAWAPAHAERENKGLGIAAGVGLPLGPLVTPGVAVGLSTVLTSLESRAVPAALLHLRGEVLGIWSPDEKISAVMPLLTADLGLEHGPLKLYLTGGVQIFGGAWRESYTYFTAFGLVGGGGLTLRLHPSISLELRCTATWVPTQTAARIEEPDPAPEEPPNLLFLSGLAGVVIPM